MAGLATRVGRAVVALLVTGAAAAAGTAGAGTARASGRGPWAGGWESAVTAGGPAFADRTVRMVVHTTTGGRALRLRLSNRYGTAPLVIGSAAVAVRAEGAAEVPGSGRPVTFDGAPAAIVPAGAELASDPVRFPAEADEDLLVSVYLPVASGATDVHADAQDTGYLSTSGDHAADPGGADYPAGTGSWYVLDGLDVLAPGTRGTLVAFGDSITDGYRSTPGSNTRWPDDLARRLAARPGGSPFGVVDAGIGGNRLLGDAPAGRVGYGAAGVRRFAHDALAEPRVRAVVLLEGINDIGMRTLPDGTPVTAARLIDGYRALIAEAHAAHVRIYGGTLLPYQGAPYYRASGEAVREAVNEWIRTGGAFDGVIDFAAALADPADPLRLLPAYDSGDHLHPDSAGYQAMADAVDLAPLR